MKISNESKVGIFTAVTLTLLILGYNYMRGRDLFRTTQTFYAVFNNVDGLVPSNPVNINGYRIGQVADVELLTNDSLKLLVTIEIDGDILVPENSTIKVYSPELLGGKAVQLLLGDATTYAGNGDTLNPYLEPGFVDNLNKITAPLREKVKSILDNLDSTFDGESGAALHMTLVRLPHTINTLDQTLNSVKLTVDGRVAELLKRAVEIEEMILDNQDNLKATMTNLKSFSDTLVALNLQATLDRANDVLTELDVALTNINEGKGTLGQLATNQELYDQMKKVSEDLDALLVDLKKNPGRYVRVSVFGKKDK